MPMFVTVPTPDLDASTEFWVGGLGFITLFSIPDQVVHLRRWAFQDVLLVPTEVGPEPCAARSSRVNFSCTLGQLDAVVADCRRLSPGSASDPYDTPWRTRDIDVVTPEGARVTVTAARPLDPDGPEARDLATVGIVAPESAEEAQWR